MNTSKKSQAVAARRSRVKREDVRLSGKWSIATLTQPVTNPQSQHSRKTGCQHKTHKDESEVASDFFNHGRSRRFVPHLRSTLCCSAVQPDIKCLSLFGFSKDANWVIYEFTIYLKFNWRIPAH
jgi:hypothetical protein